MEECYMQYPGVAEVAREIGSAADMKDELSNIIRSAAAMAKSD